MIDKETMQRAALGRREFLVRTFIAGAFVGAMPFRASALQTRAEMRTYQIARTDLVVSRIAYGCSSLVGWHKEYPNSEAIQKATTLISTAYENGINLFDLADGYGFGHAESAFGEVIKRSPGLRDKIILQSKCGVRNPSHPLPLDAFAMDLSYQHIINAVEGSLKRLSTDRLDILLLHGIDVLGRPDEIAQAFDQLKRGGKVRYFGVSNHTAGQLELLKQSVREPLVVNQIPLGLPRPGLIQDSLYGGWDSGGAAGGDRSVLDYCRRNSIQIQAYSPLRGDLLNAKADVAPAVARLRQRLSTLAQQKNTNPSAIALAWLLNHPAGILPIVGTSNPRQIVENCAADRVVLSRSEWYSLFYLTQSIPSQKSLTPSD